MRTITKKLVMSEPRSLCLSPTKDCICSELYLYLFLRQKKITKSRTFLRAWITVLWHVISGLGQSSANTWVRTGNEGALDGMAPSTSTHLSVNEVKLNCLDGEVGIRRVLVNFGLDFLVSLQVFNIYIHLLCCSVPQE